MRRARDGEVARRASVRTAMMVLFASGMIAVLICVERDAVGRCMLWMMGLKK